MNIDNRYDAYKRKQSEDEKAAVEAAGRAAQELKDAYEWLSKLLSNRFSEDDFSDVPHVWNNSTKRRMGPLKSLAFKGTFYFFYAPARGTVSIYAPLSCGEGCHRIGTYGDDFDEQNFFQAVEDHLNRPFN